MTGALVVVVAAAAGAVAALLGWLGERALTRLEHKRGER